MVPETLRRLLPGIEEVIRGKIGYLMEVEDNNSDFLPDFKHNLLGGISWVVGSNVALSIGSFYKEQPFIPTEYIWHSAIALGTFAIFLLIVWVIEEIYHNFSLPS